MVEVEKLVKHFGSIRAVNGISFSVKKGEVLGFLGPNGAGKSTTMKMITCFITPTSGTARVKGFDILKNPIEVREQIGYMPENAPLYDDMTVQSFLVFVAQVRGFSGADIQKRIDKVYETCTLRGVRFQPLHTLSKGFRQRVCFAQALLHDPEIMILDEPTDGLDPNQKHAVREMIREMSQDKVILLSTHILEEVDAVCSRSIIISEGQIKFDGTPDELHRRSEFHGAVLLSLKTDDSESVKSTVKAMNGVRRVEDLGHDEKSGQLKIRCFPEKDQEIAIPLASLLREKNLPTAEFTVEQGRLEEVFRNITRSA